MPSKKITVAHFLMQGNKEDKFIEERRRGLSYFCEKVAGIKYIYYCDCFQLLIRTKGGDIEKSLEAMPTPFDMLRQYVSKKKKFIDVTVPQDMDDATYKGARGFIRKLKNGYVEILIDEDRFDEEFGKVAKLMLNDPKIREYMVHDARRHKVKRPVRTSKSRDRVICFRGKRYEFDGAF